MSALHISVGRGASRLPADTALALSLLPSLPRPLLERLVQRLVDHLDDEDGDPDFEPEETDHSGGEDDNWQRINDGPGCPIADCDMGVDDEPHDPEADLAPAFDYGEDQSVIPLWQPNQ